jgi:hypothetical protein
MQDVHQNFGTQQPSTASALPAKDAILGKRGAEEAPSSSDDHHSSKKIKTEAPPNPFAAPSKGS